ncbi:hypothetical protein [Lysinibacillus capsici]|uniref:hypothetical protein n=2 Tax=Bacillaceae TaxID=186817 RepID=UPI0021A357AA|nr:hypothetical protein [Lysinibacillus capsici]MCT1542039.1 hypothetical protein [Lysinibacillus capsici]MCT1728648.1 hypothetical protein [Lysinibacillus capsici]
MNAYKNVMKQIHASEEFKRKMQEEMMKYEKRSFMKKVRISVGSLVACAVIAVLAMVNINHDTPIDLTERIVADHSTPAASALVNIEGTITEVGEDGLSFTLDNGMEVVVTDKTKIGIDGPTAPPKEEQLFEPTFRVGNLIGGYTEDTSSNPVQAAAIYTNWNFEHPIR